MQLVSRKLDMLLTRNSETDPILFMVGGMALGFIMLPLWAKILSVKPPSYVIFNDITRRRMAYEEKKNDRISKIGDALLIGIVASIIATWVWALL